VIRVCPNCGTRLASQATLPLGRVVSLIGGLGLIAAYFMPWFGVPQGVTLSGDSLGRILGGTVDLRRFLPGATGGATEVLALRGLVFLFPTCGVLAVLLTLGACAWPAAGRPLGFGLAASGLVPLLALGVGLTRLPPGASPELGLGLIGAGALMVLLGLALGRLGLRS
jgi:hypothetical protein